MKNLLLLILSIMSIHSYAQNSDQSQRKAIIKIVDQFFESLEKQDTVLYKETVIIDGQVWAINNTQAQRSKSMRYFRDDYKMFNPGETWQEKALEYDIKFHNGIATAWVPYEFRINGRFSHCGVDIFILLETTEGWKISNATYTKETRGCEELKR